MEVLLSEIRIVEVLPLLLLLLPANRNLYNSKLLLHSLYNSKVIILKHELQKLRKNNFEL